MPDGADLSLPTLATTVAEFLAGPDLRPVALICDDWGDAQLVISPTDTDRVANLVLVSYEASGNDPPGRRGQLLGAAAAPPGGTLLTAQFLRPPRSGISQWSSAPGPSGGLPRVPQKPGPSPAPRRDAEPWSPSLSASPW